MKKDIEKLPSRLSKIVSRLAPALTVARIVLGLIGWLIPWPWRIILSLAFALSMGTVLVTVRGTIPWQLEYFLTLASTLGLSLAILFVPKKILACLSLLGIKPNGISLAGLVIFLTGAIVFLKYDHNFGIMIGGVGGTLDNTDGKQAKAEKEFGIWRSPREKRRGKWLDPLGDKIKYLPVIIRFSFAGIIQPLVAFGIVALDVIGTVLRNPINIGARLAWSAKKMQPGRLKRALYWTGMRLFRKSKASGFGKVKSTLQSLGLIPCIPFFLQWRLDQPTLPKAIYCCALAFGALSLISRARVHPKFDKAIDRVGDAGDLFSHQDI
ncbi:MAG: hypothetical protein WC750_04710 [Patescibacteria group bacterium]